MNTPVFELCDEHVRAVARINPVFAVSAGIEVDDPAFDFGPDGLAAQAERDREALRRLDALPIETPADQLAADHLRERLRAGLASYDSGEWMRTLRAPFGVVQLFRNYADLIPGGGDEQWRRKAELLAGVPDLMAGWRRCLEIGMERGVVAARRQALEAATQAEKYVEAKSFDALLGEYADVPVRGRLQSAVDAIHAAYAETAAFLKDRYAPVAAEADGVGAERYAIASRLTLGADIDPLEAYEWGWEELRRVESEIAAEADRILPSASLQQVVTHLDASEYVDGEDAYLDWLRETHETAISELDGTHFDIDPRLKNVDVVLVRASSAGAAYYTGPTEDLSRPGRTWWPLGNRRRFETWSEATTVFHEGVPGHHLQVGQTKVSADRLSRYTRTGASISGHAEGWALYAESLADELGWLEAPGRRLGMLQGSAVRAARVVIDIGVHLDLPIPAPECDRHGKRWTFDSACEVLRDRGRLEPYRVHPEIVRYFGWPAQAPSYKLGERAWLAARDEARARLGSQFDLKAWHTAALNLGPVGLETLADKLRDI
ncbi:MAG: DUF885 domain-containing protein [Stackebrandtia sp.]